MPRPLRKPRQLPVERGAVPSLVLFLDAAVAFQDVLARTHAFLDHTRRVVLVQQAHDQAIMRMREVTKLSQDGSSRHRIREVPT